MYQYIGSIERSLLPRPTSRRSVVSLATLEIVILLLLPLAAITALVTLVVAIARGVSRPPAPSAAAQAALRHGRLITALAWIVLVLAVAFGTVPAMRLSPSGLVSAVLAVAGLLYVGVHALGEQNFPRPQGSIRRASLMPRSAADVAPRWLRTATWAWLALAVVIAVAGALTSSDGHSITRVTGDLTRTASPYPGLTYAVPALVAIAVVVLAAEGALRLVGQRPAVMDADPAWDLALRRLSAHRALRGGQLVCGLTVAVLVLHTGTALHAVGHEGIGGALVALAVLLGLASLVITVMPAAGPSSQADVTPLPGAAADVSAARLVP